MFNINVDISSTKRVCRTEEREREQYCTQIAAHDKITDKITDEKIAWKKPNVLANARAHTQKNKTKKGINERKK